MPSTISKISRYAVILSLVLGSQAYAKSQAETEKEMRILQEKVRYISDKEEIRDVYLHYMRGFDRNDAALIKSAFWPEVLINYGKYSFTVDDFISKVLGYEINNLSHFQHLITNQSIDIDGDTAHVETYVTAFHSEKDDKTTISGGRYIDRFDRRNGEWRIAVHEYIPNYWTEGQTALDSHLKRTGSGCAMGTLDRHDPSYIRPLQPRVASQSEVPCAK